MFTPEYTSRETCTFILVASHSLETPEALQWSIAFNQARVAQGLSHVPEWLHTARVVHDSRGQAVPDAPIAEPTSALTGVCQLDFMR